MAIFKLTSIPSGPLDYDAVFDTEIVGRQSVDVPRSDFNWVPQHSH